MPRELSGRRVFIASPGGLEGARAQLRHAIAMYNERYSFDEGVAFLPCGWESVSGTVDRPQDAINPLLHACDFMILLLWDRWGSVTGGDGGYSSGTEEEFYEAIDLLADVDEPLRDVLIVFKSVDERKMGDPGRQLAKVLEFRNALEESRTVLFHTVDTDEELVDRVGQRLRGWAGPLGAKTPKQLVLPSSNRNVVQQTIDTTSALAAPELLQQAEDLASKGFGTQAEAVFSRAIESRDPDVLLRFARFLRRTGRLERSFQVDQEVVELTVLSPDPAARARGADALANMGVVRRKQGKLIESLNLLDEAVKTARAAGLPGRHVLAYALDNMAWTKLRFGDLPAAQEAFNESLTLRRDAGDRRGEAQSLINLARVAQSVGDRENAAAQLVAAIGILDDGIDEPSHANALVGLAELELANGSHTVADEHLQQALAINERLGNSDGMSVTSAVLARCALTTGDYSAAARCAERCRLESARSGNQEGLGLAFQILGDVDLAERRWGSAAERFTDASALFRQIGDPAREAASLVGLTESLAHAGRHQEASAALEKARDRSSQTQLHDLDASVARVSALLAAIPAPQA